MRSGRPQRCSGSQRTWPRGRFPGRAWRTSPIPSSSPSRWSWSRCRGSRRQSVRLRRGPVPLQRVVQPRADAADREPLLRKRVPVPHGDGLVLERLFVDGEGPRRPYFVLPTITPADLATVVVLDDLVPAQFLVERPRPGSHAFVPRDQREDRRFDGCDLRVEAEDNALAIADDLLVVGVAEERDEDAFDAHGRLDHVRRVAVAVGVDPFELRARMLRVLGEVELAAIRDSLELLPADRVEVLDVARRGRVVRALRLVVLPQTEVLLPEAETAVPGEPLVEPVFEPLRRVRRRHEELHLHLLELADAEEEVAGCDLVPKRLAYLGDPERRLAPSELGDVLEIDEDALGSL